MDSDDLVNGDDSPPNSPHSARPSTTSPPSSPSQSINSDDIIRLHSLPPILSKMDDGDVVKLGYACEARDVLEDEMRIAERHYRQMILVARSYELRVLHAKSQLEQANSGLRSLIDTAVGTVSSVTDDFPPDRYRGHPCSVRSAMSRPHPYMRSMSAPRRFTAREQFIPSL